MAIKNDLVGKRFGKLVVTSLYGKVNGSYKWNCICDCGNEKVIDGHSLTRGRSKSCGCSAHARKYKIGDKFGYLTIANMPNNLRNEKVTCICDCGNTVEVFLSNLIKGTTRSCGCKRSFFASQSRCANGESRSILYRKWARMNTRCYNPNTHYYKNYGGRGIKVCDEWRHSYVNFKEWAITHGYSDELTLDRIDVNGNYCPENCRWITMAEQSNNKRTNRFLEVNGERKTLAQWSRETGLDPSLIRWRLENGKSLSECISTKKYSTKF